MIKLKIRRRIVKPIVRKLSTILDMVIAGLVVGGMLSPIAVTVPFLMTILGIVTLSLVFEALLVEPES